MLARSEHGRFIKGVSGNPGGRPRVLAGVRDLAKVHTEEAIQTLVTVANDPKASDSARVQAATALLDRAWGKPQQYVESVNLNGDLKDFLASLTC